MGLGGGDSQVTTGFPSQRVSYAKCISMSWQHHVAVIGMMNCGVIVPRWLSMADPTSGYFTYTEALLSLTGMEWRWLQVTEEKTYKVLMLIMTRYSVQIRDWNSPWHGTNRPQQPWWISRNFLAQPYHGCIDMSVQDLEKIGQWLHSEISGLLPMRNNSSVFAVQLYIFCTDTKI